jgi:hypothetical protein
MLQPVRGQLITLRCTLRPFCSWGDEVREGARWAVQLVVSVEGRGALSRW